MGLLMQGFYYVLANQSSGLKNVQHTPIRHSITQYMLSKISEPFIYSNCFTTFPPQSSEMHEGVLNLIQQVYKEVFI